ncbi:hypothetical protein CQ006_12405 [Pseudomonas cedrina]|uniref:Uncharacterized protein n=1 Tax=Pseudomonas cedrina TaxID=651740 RepID=A0A2S9DR98_PSECE|nr:hypothetical protein CLM72_06330 [Pseudomonas sp. MYb193]PRC05115.1 hypothetical protein CQ006_12405 [Pseudomonas cedrina]
MACNGCAARREWVNKMKRLAYERASELLTGRVADRAEEADLPARTDSEPADSDDRSAGR